MAYEMAPGLCDVNGHFAVCNHFVSYALSNIACVSYDKFTHERESARTTQLVMSDVQSKLQDF